MSLNYEISEGLKKILSKLVKKDKALAIAVNKKIKQISQLDISSINHFKNLKAPLSHFKRVHVGNFVLTFEVKENRIIFRRFSHHDKAY